MSYTIEYSPQKNRRYPKVVRNGRKVPSIVLFVGLIISLYFINKLDIGGIRSLWYSALETLADNIKEGTQIGESIAECISSLNG